MTLPNPNAAHPMTLRDEVAALQAEKPYARQGVPHWETPVGTEIAVEMEVTSYVSREDEVLP